MTKRVTAPPEKVALYQRLIESVEGAAARSNFGSAYTAVNGNMYSMISKHGVVGIRLPEPDRSVFLAAYNTELFRGDPAWPPAREFVAVPDAAGGPRNTPPVSRAQLRIRPDAQAEGQGTSEARLIRRSIPPGSIITA